MSLSRAENIRLPLFTHLQPSLNCQPFYIFLFLFLISLVFIFLFLSVATTLILSWTTEENSSSYLGLSSSFCRYGCFKRRLIFLKLIMPFIWNYYHIDTVASTWDWKVFKSHRPLRRSWTTCLFYLLLIYCCYCCLLNRLLSKPSCSLCYSLIMPRLFHSVPWFIIPFIINLDLHSYLGAAKTWVVGVWGSTWDGSWETCIFVQVLILVLNPTSC